MPTAWIIRQWHCEDPSFDAEVNAINRATRRRGAFTYAPDVREDLVSEIMVAILDGSVALADVKTTAPRIISAYRRGRDTYRCQSMDAFVFDGKKGSLHDLIGW